MSHPVLDGGAAASGGDAGAQPLHRPSGFLPPRVALFASLALLGLLGLVYQEVAIRDPSTGVTIVAMSALALLVVVCGTRPALGKIVLANAVAIVVLALSLLGMCASRCGSFQIYESLFGAPTAVVGLTYHVIALVAGLLTAARVFTGTLPLAVVCVPGVGASLFYLSVMAAYGHWCGSCAAVHALVLAQAIEMFRVTTAAGRRVHLALGILVVAGGLNLVYHHRPYARVENDAADLVSYLRANRTGSMPIGSFVAAPTVRVTEANAVQGEPARPSPSPAVDPAVPRSSEAAMSARDREQLLERSHARRSAASSARHETAGAALRPIGDATLWGRRAAPLLLRFNIDPMCPACRLAFLQARTELSPLVDAGTLAVEFVLTWRLQPAEDDIGKQACYLAVASGLLGEKSLLSVLDGIYASAAATVSAQTLVEMVGPDVDRVALAAALSENHRRDIESRLRDGFNLTYALGAAGTPNFWFYRAGDREPCRRLEGAQNPDVVPFVIKELLKTPVTTTPTTTPTTAATSGNQE